MYDTLLLHEHFGSFAALTLDVEAGGEIVGVDADAVEVEVFGGGIAAVGFDAFDAGKIPYDIKPTPIGSSLISPNRFPRDMYNNAISYKSEG